MTTTQTILKASDLRVGNWVQTNLYNIKVEVTALPLGEVYSDIHGHFKLKELEPIELTPEILENMGFEAKVNYWKDGTVSVSKMHYYLPDSRRKIPKITIFLKDSDDEMSVYIRGVNGNIKTPQYLHQLQNLYFALTGEELEINL